MGTLLERMARPMAKRSGLPLSWDTYQSYFNYNNLSYPLQGGAGTLQNQQEEPTANFAGYVEGLYKSNGVVFACMAARYLLFSEARFQFRARRSGRPGKLFGSLALNVLEKPWQGGTTGDLLRQAIIDVDLGGNSFTARRPNGLMRMRPDWTTIVMGSRDPRAAEQPSGWDLDAEVVGYVYKPGGPASSEKPQVYLAEEVAHFAPYPDPLARFRGMSWLTPVIREVMGDAAATAHKLSFFEHGATPNMVVTLSPDIKPEQFKQWIELFEEGHQGALEAYKTLYFGGGADIEVVGANMRQVAFKEVQGAGETRIAAAAQIPPVIVGLSEGLSSATYSNYQQARRRLSDGTMRPLWRDFAGSISTLIDVPADAELWYDDRDVAWLQDDVVDAASVAQMESMTIKALVDAGFEQQSVVSAVVAGDWNLLRHTGMFSVQLQPPGTSLNGAAPSPNGNGNGVKPPAEVEKSVLLAQLTARADARARE